jgi:FkbM family methyltransferase
MHKAVGPTGHVLAFEPQPELACYLRELKSAFRLSQLTIVEAGLSSTSGRRELVRPSHWGAASLHLEADAESDVLPIATMKLDDYFRRSTEDLRPLRFIKADIQGHEYDCFVGAKQLISEDRPEILCECLDEELPRVRLYLQWLGYDGYFFIKNKLTPLARLEELRSSVAAPYLNYIFQPCDRAAVLSKAA